jgi:hypothetical protein
MVILALLLAAPLADVLVFGIHEHEVSSGSPDQLATSGQSDVHIAHHCDLSMNPAEVGSLKEPAGLVVVAVVVPPPPPSHVRNTPFVPLTPPRA